MLPPDSTAEYAREHDGTVAACLSTLLYGDAVSPLPAAAASAAHLPLGYGGLGLRSAAAAAPAAYWASWQDSLPALLARLPTEAEQLLASLNSPHAGMPPALAAACSAAAAVRQAGFPTKARAFGWEIAKTGGSMRRKAEGKAGHLAGTVRNCPYLVAYAAIIVTSAKINFSEGQAVAEATKRRAHVRQPDVQGTHGSGDGYGALLRAAGIRQQISQRSDELWSAHKPIYGRKEWEQRYESETGDGTAPLSMVVEASAIWVISGVIFMEVSGKDSAYRRKRRVD
ncbi:hypothetical protein AK812_SmicGene12266 [Symbiodinium microadriaticum]|uniref:Uncharacterized protein n=1 Tax=Symbiodinium microadriaticum TaxID=2951 RepID=A0A1Q9EB57_SYMMI|nr:hypothetical protein AK812_SmicGene12266 [Symbiodinium microadriaticum]